MSNEWEKKLDSSALEFAKVERIGPDAYSAENYGDLVDCRLRISIFKAGANWARAEMLESQKELVQALEKALIPIDMGLGLLPSSQETQLLIGALASWTKKYGGEE